MSEEEAALRALLRARNRLLEEVWAALATWQDSEATASALVADLRRRGLMPTE